MPNCVQVIDVATFKQLCASNAEQCLIDVREPAEFQLQRIHGVQNVPKDTLVDRIQTIAKNHQSPIYLHCRAGVRSYAAAEMLIQHGYENVYSVAGGLNAWIQSGYPVETSN